MKATDPAHGEAAADTVAIEFPALFVAASEASRRGKAWTKGLAFMETMLVLAGLGIAAVAASSLVALPTMDLANAVSAVIAGAFLGSIFLKVLSRSAGYDDDWYVGRAVAEAVRSESWSYMMRVAPYATDAADEAFAQKIAELLARSREIRHGPVASGAIDSQISGAMIAVRALTLNERRQVYVRQRLRDQISWYNRRAANHRRWSSIWLIATVACQVVAAVLAFSALHEVVMSREMNPPGQSGEVFLRVMSLLGATALAITAWTQLNRDEELAKAYGFSVQELALTVGQAERARTEDQLAAAVAAGEAVIRRENRAWLARRIEVIESTGLGESN